MNRLLAPVLFVTLLTLSCNKSATNSSPNADIIAPSPDSVLANEALTFDDHISLINMNVNQEDKYRKAIEITKLVVATEDFKNQVLNHTFNGVKTFANNNGLTNAQIYQTILEAAEQLHPAKNNAMDLEVELYYEDSTVIGYTNPSTTRIWVNTKYFDQYYPNSVAGNLFHEWLHKVGYDHDVTATAQRPFSVPYAVGYMIGNIGKNFL